MTFHVILRNPAALRLWENAGLDRYCLMIGPTHRTFAARMLERIPRLSIPSLRTERLFFPCMGGVLPKHERSRLTEMQH